MGCFVRKSVSMDMYVCMYVHTYIHIKSLILRDSQMYIYLPISNYHDIMNTKELVLYGLG